MYASLTITTHLSMYTREVFYIAYIALSATL